LSFKLESGKKYILYLRECASSLEQHSNWKEDHLLGSATFETWSLLAREQNDLHLN